MNSFNTEIHSDETASYEPTAADWQEYSEWVDSQESQTHTPEGEYIWSDEAIEWEEGFHPDDLYAQ